MNKKGRGRLGTFNKKKKKKRERERKKISKKKEKKVDESRGEFHAE